MARRPWIPILLLFLVVGGSAAAELSFETVAKEFRSLVLSNRYGPDRRAAVVRAAEFDTEDAAKLLIEGVEGLSEKLDHELEDLAKVEEEYAPLNTNTDVAEDEYKTRDALRERIGKLDGIILEDEKVLDEIEKALAGLSSEAAHGAVAKAVRRGKAWRTRAVAARSAAVYPGDVGRDAAFKALKDKDARVAISALHGLAERADEATVAEVAACLKHDVWVVKVTAADTLASIGSPKGIRPLIEALAKTTGRIQSDINEALKTLTGQNFEPDYEQWQRWYEEHKEEFEGEGAKPLAKARGRREKDPDDPTYYGIQTKSKRIVYVLDISGSMKLEIGGKGTSTPKPGEEEKPSGPKIEIAKRELKNAIRKLPEDASFNIITFNHLVKLWQPAMRKAKQDNKNKAYLFIRDLEASGSTYTYGALKEAFKLAGLGATDPNYDSGVDTIFLLSDGAPTDQSFPLSKLMEPDKILDAVRQWNKLSKIVIHAIAIDPKTQGSSFIRFMKELAEQNHGEYTERG